MATLLCGGGGLRGYNFISAYSSCLALFRPTLQSQMVNKEQLLSILFVKYHDHLLQKCIVGPYSPSSVFLLPASNA